MEINGYTRTCGLIGNPVEHTMSPAIHNNLAKITGENLVYVPFHVGEGRLKEAIEGAHALNLLGLNVTVPYKQAVIPFLEETDPLAAQIGAVNTLVRTGKGYKGYNTDMPGLYRAMLSDGVSIEGEEVLILGAGGVARAVAVLLLQKKAAGVILLNRTVERAARIAEEVNAMAEKSGGSAGEKFARALSLQEYDKIPTDRKYLAIQATSVGMFPDTEAVVIEYAAFYERIHTGYDLIFNPVRTRFMKLVETCGGRAFCGYKMLLYQAVIAYELWTGRQIEDELAQRIYEEYLVKA
ncbi:MAG: shikimate dehydrogenase [Lachnoclostridium sp.]|nr:shikimate dehydrogenase [Lachnospira sp.]MCM1249061.1 shikimate dehydrogenase [Lachnoclostridium sp.]MCM1535810.1 shikimate dehydrogenase [Clostridium sp.]